MGMPKFILVWCTSNLVHHFFGGERILFRGKDYIAVVNFLATKIEVSIAEQVVNDNIKVVACGVSDYAGFIDGEFLEPENLFDAINTAFVDAQSVVSKKIDSIYIGVPAEFCNYALKNLKANYSSKVVIKQRHIDDLFEGLSDDSFDSDYTIISKSPLYYVLDDGVQTIDPIDNFSKNLGVKASFVLADNRFIEIITDIINQMRLKDVSFVPIPLAVNSVLLSDAERQNGAIIVDFGYVSTCVTSCVGEGLVDMKTFGVGDGHIMADLAEVLKLDYFTVDELKKQLILTLEPNQLDNYELNVGANIYRVSTHQANDVVLARLDSIAEIINKILLSFQYKQDRSVPIYLTGSGITYIKGAKNYLSKILNRKCVILAPKQVEYSTPSLAEKFSLIKFVFDSLR